MRETGHISTSGLKSDVTIVFLDPDFPYSRRNFGDCTINKSAFERTLFYLIVSCYDTPLTNLSLITFTEMQHIQLILNQIYLQAQNIRENAGD